MEETQPQVKHDANGDGGPHHRGTCWCVRWWGVAVVVSMHALICAVVVVGHATVMRVVMVVVWGGGGACVGGKNSDPRVPPPQ
jgi:hypothetical protein